MDQARELVETARLHNAPLQVGHIERFNPALDALEELLTQPRFIESHRLSPFPNRSTDIDVVLDLMIHDLEIILHLVSSRVAGFDAVGVPVLSGQADIANVRLKFENACVANITASRVSPEKMRKIRIFQSDTYISLDYQDQAGQIFRKAGDTITRDKVKVIKDEPLKRELASFVEVAKAGGEPRVTGAQGAAALELAVRVSEDIRQTNAEMPAL
jgi:predicted dehydrogenase